MKQKRNVSHIYIHAALCPQPPILLRLDAQVLDPWKVFIDKWTLELGYSPYHKSSVLT